MPKMVQLNRLFGPDYLLISGLVLNGLTTFFTKQFCIKRVITKFDLTIQLRRKKLSGPVFEWLRQDG
jgi:hypothetical protein